MIRVVSREPLPLKQWSRVSVTYDGSSQAAGVMAYVNGAPVEADVVSDNLTRTIKPNGGGLFGGEWLGIMFGRRFRFTPMKDGAIDEFRVFNRALTPLEVKFLDEEVGRPPRRPSRPRRLKPSWSRPIHASSRQPRRSAARTEHNQIVSVVPPVPVMGDTLRPRPTYLLIRGVYYDHGDEVQPQGLAQIFSWDSSLPRTRIGLARWLFDPKHPLTSRVFVNRMWQRTFGRGSSRRRKTSAQGSIPSHPELLDWLAVSFVESGWNVKAPMKQFVMSATFRQSSIISDELLKTRVTFCSRASVACACPPKWSATMRWPRADSQDARGGRPKRIPVPARWDMGWSGCYSYPAADKVPMDSHHRRTLHSFIKRNAPHPAMANFDMPDRGTSVVRRQTSNTPLQALVLLDDPQYVEAYRAGGERSAAPPIRPPT